MGCGMTSGNRLAICFAALILLQGCISSGTHEPGPPPLPYVSKLTLNLPHGYDLVRLPDDWLRGGGLTEAVNRNIGVAVILSAKSHGAIPDIDSYAKGRYAANIGVSTVKERSELSQVQINGRRAYRWTYLSTELIYEPDMYVCTIIEGPREIATISAWASPRDFDKYKDEILHLADGIVGF
jgi:hypothetical protein